jgi:RNA polymerase sigma-70 factor (ECF subfamily)
LAVARRFARDEAEARAAVQVAFIAAFNSIDALDHPRLVDAWLRRTIIEASVAKLRNRGTPELAIDDLLPRFLEDGHHIVRPPEWQAPANVLVERPGVRELVMECIDRLPETYRTVLLLRDIEGLDTTETGRLLEIGDDTVKSRLHRARLALTGLLEARFGRGES